MTPLANAKKVNQLSPQSHLLIQDGPGHCSVAMTSVCTWNAIRGYFLNNTLPANGTICAIDETIFPKSDTDIWNAGTTGDKLQLAEKIRAFDQAFMRVGG